jgi:hypothetical protein
VNLNPIYGIIKQQNCFENEEGLRMLANAHRKAAEDIESTILPLQAQPRAARVVIEGAWGAAFQWIAFGCETKYQQHLNNHTRLGRFLRSLGEKAAADWWEALDLTRQAGWYGGEPDIADADKALSLLEQIRLWATQ